MWFNVIVVLSVFLKCVYKKKNNNNFNLTEKILDFFYWSDQFM